MSSQDIRQKLKNTSIGKVLVKAKRSARNRQFQGSANYWEERYAQGLDSGAGSYGRLAEYKAKVLNEFVATHDVASVIEFGCGDGNQLSLAKYPKYAGVDVSASAIQRCIARFITDNTKSFFLAKPDTTKDEAGFLTADLALSLDVIYHLIEDEVFDTYMRNLFRAGRRFVIVYASNDDLPQDSHVRSRNFTGWIKANEPTWKFKEKMVNPYPYDPADPTNTSIADFYVFERA